MMNPTNGLLISLMKQAKKSHLCIDGINCHSDCPSCRFLPKMERAYRNGKNIKRIFCEYTAAVWSLRGDPVDADRFFNAPALPAQVRIEYRDEDVTYDERVTIKNLRTALKDARKLKCHRMIFLPGSAPVKKPVEPTCPHCRILGMLRGFVEELEESNERRIEIGRRIGRIEALGRSWLVKCPILASHCPTVWDTGGDGLLILWTEP